MSAPYSNIETKCELAVKAHIERITTRIPGVNVYAGIESLNLDSNTVRVPCVVAFSEGCEEYPPISGQYTVDMKVEVMSNANDSTAATHRERVAWIRDEFANTWISISLSQSISDFTAAGVVLQPSTQEFQDTNWVTNIPMKIYCRPSD